jgi:hypothetical protein
MPICREGSDQHCKGPDSRKLIHLHRTARAELLHALIVLVRTSLAAAKTAFTYLSIGRLAMTMRIVSTGLCSLLLICSSTLLAAEEKPPKSTGQMDHAQMKKHCDDMMKGKDMSNMSAAEHEAMMKQCREMMKEQDADKKKPAQ